MIACSCPGCGQNYRLADEAAGRTVRCRECQGAFTVPGPEFDRDDAIEGNRPARSAAKDKDLVIHCGHCGTEYLLDRSFAGRMFRCRTCSGTIQAPGVEWPDAEDPADAPRIGLGAGHVRGRFESGPKLQKSSRLPGFLGVFGLVIGSILVLSGLVWLTLVAANRLSSKDRQARPEVPEPPDAIAQRPWNIAEPRRKSFGSMIERAKKNAESLTAPGDVSGPPVGRSNAITPSETASSAPQANSGFSNSGESQAPAVAADEMPLPKANETRPVRTEKKAARKREITPLGEHHRASKALVDTGSEISGLLSVLNRPEDLEGTGSRLKALFGQFDEIVARFEKLPVLKPDEKSQIVADYGEAVRLLETRLGEERKRILEFPEFSKAIGPELDAVTDSISKLKDGHF